MHLVQTVWNFIRGTSCASKNPHHGLLGVEAAATDLGLPQRQEHPGTFNWSGLAQRNPFLVLQVIGNSYGLAIISGVHT
jgi:hypothetical protein